MANKSQFQIALINEVNANTAVTFAAGASVSSIFNCAGVMVAGLYLPSNWTNCNITFKVSKTENGTFVPMSYFDGTAYTVAASASTNIPIIPALLHSKLFVQLSCSTPQVSACSVDFDLAPIYQGIHS